MTTLNAAAAASILKRKAETTREQTKFKTNENHYDATTITVHTVEEPAPVLHYTKDMDSHTHSPDHL